MTTGRAVGAFPVSLGLSCHFTHYGLHDSNRLCRPLCFCNVLLKEKRIHFSAADLSVVRGLCNVKASAWLQGPSHASVCQLPHWAWGQLPHLPFTDSFQYLFCKHLLAMMAQFLALSFSLLRTLLALSSCTYSPAIYLWAQLSAISWVWGQEGLCVEPWL